MTLPTVIFDFDGTLALGPGPVQAYAQQVAVLSGESAILDLTKTALEELDSGAGPYLDAYDAVRQLALKIGIDDALLSQAYLASRAELGTPTAPVVSPSGLGVFMRRLAKRADLVLATNAPPVGVEAVLDAMRIHDYLAEVRFSVGKPAGLGPLVLDYRENGPVLAVGDIWAWDLAVPAEFGADTALVGPTASRRDVQPTMRGRNLAELYGDILTWAEASASGLEAVNAFSGSTNRKAHENA